MNAFKEAIATLGITGSIAAALIIVFCILQIAGELIEAFGKVVPTFFKVRKIFTARKKRQAEQDQTLQDVKSLLAEVNAHYSADCINKRDKWMQWVNDRAVVYDKTIIDYKDAIDKLTQSLDNNTRMTERMFIESSRDRIIDFASKVSSPVCHVSREEFHRIFKVYEKYEAFLEDHGMTNGEVEINYQIIKDAYKERTESHTFIEDIRNMHK